MAVDFSGQKSDAWPDFHLDEQQNWSSSESKFSVFGSSDLGTPVESELDSTEDGSEDDDFMADLTRQMNDYMLHDTDEDNCTKPIHNLRNLKKSESAQWFKPSQVSNPIGSGMKAVFLGSPESRSTSIGTGVFLPRVNSAVTLPPTGKKTRCSMVLIPDRVLQVLEQHFNSGPTRVIVGDDVYKGQLVSQKQPTIKCDGNEIHLPQEWTY